MPKSAEIMGLWQLVGRILNEAHQPFQLQLNIINVTYEHLVPSVYFLSHFLFPSCEREKKLKIKNAGQVYTF
jgi:hypothetical protein